MALALARELRDVTRQEALADYHVLQAEPPPTEATFRRTGLRMLDYFFLHHRIKARTKRHLSFFEAMRDPEIVDHLDELVQRYKKHAPSSYTQQDLQKARYSVFQLYYGTINQFRPVNAKWIYHRYAPKHGVLDFSAGWGGRCLAAMSMGIPYVGIDANQNLEPAYRAMIHAAHPISPTTMLFQPSETVDFSRYTYDLIFTSPPYFMVEEYERMPKYASKEAFLQNFFLPVVNAAWSHLKKGGYMVLNMPEEMKDALTAAHFLPRSTKLAMPLSNRHPTNAAYKQQLGTANTQRQEWIYVWHKTA